VAIKPLALPLHRRRWRKVFAIHVRREDCLDI
jgi:hypothetical protein